MRHGSSNRRSRNRGNGGRRGNQPRAQVFDSNGPDVRIRGTAYQVHEKYLALAKDSAAQGDRVLAESYHQHAEHYQRLINSWDDNESASSSDAYAQKPEKQGGSAPEDDLGLPAGIVGKAPCAKQTGPGVESEAMADA
jgi:hypothetical protein